MDLDYAQASTFYEQMLLIRRFEEQSGRLYMAGKIRGFLHLYIGQEAVAVGAISALRSDDYIITHYRDHGHALARGMDPNIVMAELARGRRRAAAAVRAAQCTCSTSPRGSWADTP